MAAKIVENQIKLGVEFDFVGADGLYGNDSVFVNHLDDMGCLYMLDIHKDRRIFLEKPNLEIPPENATKEEPLRWLKPTESLYEWIFIVIS